MHLTFKKAKIVFRDQILHKSWLDTVLLIMLGKICLAYWILRWKAIFKKGKEKHYLSSETQWFSVKFTDFYLRYPFFFLRDFCVGNGKCLILIIKEIIKKLRFLV